MNKLVSNKKYFIIVILLIILIGGIAIGAIMRNTELLSRIGINIKKEEETIVDGIYLKPYDNLGEKIKALVTVTRIDGIDSIEYISDNGEPIKLNCNQKQTVGIDIEVLVNENHEFKVISNGEETIETVSLKENYMDDYIVITKLDDVEELEYHQVAIDFKQQGEYSNYYNFNTSTWKSYQDTIKVDMSNVNIDTLLKGEYDATVYAQCVDKAGNTLRVSKTVPVTKRKNFDLFTNMDSSGRTNLNEYGLTASWGGNFSGGTQSTKWFSVGQMGAAHGSWNANYWAKFDLDWKPTNKRTFDSITAEYVLATGGPVWAKAGVTGQMTIFYTDGTRDDTSKGISGSTLFVAELKPDKTKEISYIQFYISAWDSTDGTSSGYVRKITFHRI